MSRHRGCHFHFCQSIYRQIQALGLVRNYEANPEIRLQVRQLMALALLPVAIVRMTFHLLQSQTNPVLLGLFEYIERQWMTSTASTTTTFGGRTTTANVGTADSIVPSASIIRTFGCSSGRFNKNMQQQNY